MASADILRAAHSPLPWSVQEDCKTSIWSGGHYVAEAYDGGEDTAAFIHRACNAHYGLLDAAKGLRQHLALFCGPDDAIANAVFKIADAAIAAAEAEAGR